MKLKYDFVIQKVMDDYCAVAVGDGALKFDGMLRFNETGKTMFECLMNDITMDGIYEVVSSRYQGDRDEIMDSIKSFVDSLKSESLIEE